ncbi:hypothetical protein J3F83DRAFT_722131 [Trichoderma novae-zelandiae]
MVLEGGAFWHFVLCACLLKDIARGTYIGSPRLFPELLCRPETLPTSSSSLFTLTLSLPAFNSILLLHTKYLDMPCLYQLPPAGRNRGSLRGRIEAWMPGLQP